MASLQSGSALGLQRAVRSLGNPSRRKVFSNGYILLKDSPRE